MDKMEKITRTTRITREGDDLWEQLAELHFTTKSHVVEILLREEAKRKGIEYREGDE